MVVDKHLKFPQEIQKNLASELTKIMVVVGVYLNLSPFELNDIIYSKWLEINISQFFQELQKNSASDSRASGADSVTSTATGKS